MAAAPTRLILECIRLLLINLTRANIQLIPTVVFPPYALAYPPLRSTVQLNWSPDTLREQSKTYWVKKASFWASRHVGGNGDRPSELARSWALQIERRHRCPDPGQSSFTQNRKGKHVPSAARSTKYCKCFEAVTDKASRTGCRCQPFTVLYTTVHGCTEAGMGPGNAVYGPTIIRPLPRTHHLETKLPVVLHWGASRGTRARGHAVTNRYEDKITSRG